MKITGVKFHLIETPRETGSISEHLMIRIDTDEGLCGWGEYPDLPDGPGLGIEVDGGHLETLRYKGTRLRQLRGDG